MDESFKCKCGNNLFWFFEKYVRCVYCYNEYFYDPGVNDFFYREWDNDKRKYADWIKEEE